MKGIESSLDWGGKLTVVVGDAFDPGDRGVVCLSEASASGTVFEIADVAASASAGTYYGESACPTKLVPADLAAHMSSSWDGPSSVSASIPVIPTQTQVESDLRNALTAELTFYTDSQMFSASPVVMKTIEPSLDWGGRLSVTVGDAAAPGDNGVVCMSETTSDGVTMAISYASPTYKASYGKVPCPAQPTPGNVAWSTSW
jgi:hypothetical protein